ncbi:MAG: twin-arginine translocation signal domain-containing protein [Acidobacteriota bacterium]
MANHLSIDRLLRRQFLGQAGALALGGAAGARLFAQSPAPSAPRATDLAIVNAKIHTMDATNRVVSQALIQNGRFAAAGTT